MLPLRGCGSQCGKGAKEGLFFVFSSLSVVMFLAIAAMLDELKPLDLCSGIIAALSAAAAAAVLMVIGLQQQEQWKQWVAVSWLSNH